MDAQSARPGEREALLEQCGRNAEEWACPRVVRDGAPTQQRQDTLRLIEIMTGCEQGALTTCPKHAAGRPDVQRALRLYRAQQSGGVSHDDDPPAAIVIAAEAIGSADAKRIEREQEERELNRG